MADRPKDRLDPAAIAPPPGSRPRQWGELGLLVAVAAVVAGLAVGLPASLSLRDILGAWRLGVVFTVGVLAIVAHVYFFDRMHQLRTARHAGLLSAQVNRRRIAHLRERLRDGGPAD